MESAFRISPLLPEFSAEPLAGLPNNFPWCPALSLVTCPCSAPAVVTVLLLKSKADCYVLLCKNTSLASGCLWNKVQNSKKSAETVNNQARPSPTRPVLHGCPFHRPLHFWTLQMLFSPILPSSCPSSTPLPSMPDFPHHSGLFNITSSGRPFLTLQDWITCPHSATPRHPVPYQE